MQSFCRFVLVLLGAIVGLPVLVVLSVVAAHFLRPLTHEQNVNRAERSNETTYQTGQGYEFVAEFRVDVGEESRIQLTPIKCVPKQEASLSFKSGAMTWDMMKRFSDDAIRSPIRESQNLVFEMRSANCYSMIRFHRQGAPEIFLYPSMSAWVFSEIEEEETACLVILRDRPVPVDGLVVHPPRVVQVREAPVRELVSREEYGPADRALNRQTSVYVGPVGIPDSTTFTWQPDEGCWESWADARSRLKQSRDGVYRSHGRPICSERAERLCGFS
ncbi:MAG TPA: hypothetical protein VHG92_00910 [Afifellaceae bacterium]|nr:hypothetical protein [Afifellaceae bacterium]